MSLWTMVGKAATKIGWKGGFMASTGLFAGSLLNGGRLIGGGGGGDSSLLVIGLAAVAGIAVALYYSKSKPGRR